MVTFDKLVDYLVKSQSVPTSLTVRDVNKKIIGMSKYASVNALESAYIKIVFEDHSLLLVIPDIKEVYYADNAIGRLGSVSDDQVGKIEKIEHNGRTFTLANANDYQFVIQKYVGGLLDIEGECRFSDYTNDDAPKAMLSLAWLSYSGERADVYCELIDLKELGI